MIRRQIEPSPLLCATHVAYLFTMLGGLFPMLVNGPSDFRDFVEDRSPLTHVINAAVHLPYLVMLLARPLMVARGLRGLFLPIAIVLLGCSSALYSSTPERSVAISGFLVLQLLASACMFATLTFDQFIRALAYACLLGIALSFALILVLPSYGTMSLEYPGAWQGIFTHKNGLGRFATFSLTIFLAYLANGKQSPVLVAGALGSVVLAIGSGSATATVALFLLALVWLALSRNWGVPVLLLILAAGAVPILLLEFRGSPLDAVLDLLDKSATLSGRTTVWQLVVDAIGSRPWFGYGLGSFWNTELAGVVRQLAGWSVPNAHNGLLEIGLQLGYVGIALYLLQLIVGGSRALVSLKWEGGVARFWPVLFLTHTLIFAMTEATLLRPVSIVQTGIFALLFYGRVHGRTLYVPTVSAHETIARK